MLTARAIPLDDQVAAELRTLIQALYSARDEGFGNAGEMRNLAEALDRRRAARIIDLFSESAPPDLGRAGSVLQIPLQVEDIPLSYQSYLPAGRPDGSSLLPELHALGGL